MSTDVTATWAPKISNWLRINANVSALDFPSMTRLRKAYHSTDYREIGTLLGSGDIEIYREEDKPYMGGYTDHKEGDYLIFDFADFDYDLLTHPEVIVHEVTHMIQDSKRMRLSIIEGEMDAFLAQALFQIRAKTEDQYPDFAWRVMEAAKAFSEDDGYLGSWSFRSARDRIEQDLREHYSYSHQRVDPDFDVGTLTKRRRLDGITR